MQSIIKNPERDFAGFVAVLSSETGYTDSSG